MEWHEVLAQAAAQAGLDDDAHREAWALVVWLRGVAAFLLEQADLLAIQAEGLGEAGQQQAADNSYRQAELFYNAAKARLTFEPIDVGQLVGPLLGPELVGPQLTAMLAASPLALYSVTSTPSQGAHASEVAACQLLARALPRGVVLVRDAETAVPMLQAVGQAYRQAVNDLLADDEGDEGDEGDESDEAPPEGEAPPTA